MNCPACRKEVQDNLSECPFCQYDIILYKKIKNISNKFYNRGLEQSNNRELSKAIDSLTKSVEFDKMNVDARNLLGLVYFEIGEIGLALTQWVISSHFEKEDNLALDYMTKIQENTRELESYNDSIRMYNESLEYIKQKSEDLAIIQLKKVLQLNPNFVKALCLLAVCFIIQNEKEKALSYIEKTLQIDISNANAIRYYKELKPNSSIPIPEVNERKMATINLKHRELTRGSSLYKGQIIGFLVGIVCSLAVFFILVIPDKTSKLNRQINDLNGEKQTLQKEIDSITNNNNERINKLEEENKNLTQSNTQLHEKQTALEEEFKIRQAEDLYDDKKYEEAASVLYSINTGVISQDSKAYYDTLDDKVFYQAGSIHYNKGKSAYSNGDYENAKSEFEKSLLYGQETNYLDNALYYLGRIYEIEQDFEKAKNFYNQTIEQYSGTDGAANAKWRLGNLK